LGRSRAAGLRADAAMSVLLEVLGLVRRCLVQQQPEVRALAYSRLALLLDDPDVVASQPVLRALCGVVQPEFAKYYDASRAHDSPIALAQCVSPASSRVVMPVAALLRCAAKLAHGMMALAASAESNGADASSGGGGLSSGPVLQQSAHAIWTDICARFSAAQLEDFELDPAGNYALDDPAGLRNHNTALLVAGCLDAALEYALMHCVSSGSCGCEPSDPNTAMKLFAKFARVGDVLCLLCVDERKRRVIALPSELSAMSLGRAAHLLQLVLPDRRRGLRSEHRPEDARDPGGSHSWYVGAVQKAAPWSANQTFVRHLLEVALARVLRRPPFAANAASQSQMPAPDSDLVLRVASAVYGGVLAYYADGADATDSDAQQLPAYLRLRGTARGRSVLQLSAELLLACANALQTGGALGRMAPAVLAPDTSSVASATEEKDEVEIEATARLLSALRKAATSLLAQRPVAVRESVHIVTLMTLLAARLTRQAVGMPPADKSSLRTRTAVHRSVNSAVGWALRVCFGDMPEDAGLLKALFALLTTCQPLLQPMDTLFSPTAASAAAGALGNMSRGRMPDCDEFAPVGQIVGTVRSASRILLDDALSDAENGEDDDGGDPNLDVYTLRTIPPLIAAITAWFKQELHRIEWVCHQLGRCAAIEKTRQQQQEEDEEDGGPDQSTANATTTITAEIFERRICLRIQAVAQMLDQLLSIRFGPRISGDPVIRALNDLHRCFLLLTKTKLARPDLPVTAEYVDTLALLCQSLNTRAYAMFLDKYTGAAESLGSSTSSTTAGDAKGMPLGAGKGDGAEGKDKKNKKSLTARAGAAKSKVLRDSALVSSLVFQIEQTEKHVILLSSRFKVPLAHYLKRSTARDFRIEAAAIPSPVGVGVSYHYGVQPGESAPQDYGAQPHEEDEEEEERAVLAENSDEETEILVEMDDGDGVAGIGDDDTGIRSDHSVDPVDYSQQTKRPRLHHR
ncbi:hypothetical protein H4S06_000486, partial [Coemansia sp. BCRC 34490]